jgi:8-oxo-dGTP diphosphatase
MPLPYCYEHPRPAVTVDLVTFAFDDRDLRILLVKRKSEPFAGQWALPGGFMEIDERLHEAALRELQEETGLQGIHGLYQLGIFDAVKRDPRGRVLSVTFVALARWPVSTRASDDAAEARWLARREIESLAFDHEEILQAALKWLPVAIVTGSLALPLLPDSFSTDQARRLFRSVGIPVREVDPWIERLAAAKAIRATKTRQNRVRPKSTRRRGRASS